MKSVLINNYYDGISPRGIIAHVNNLAALMADEGIKVSVFKCPVWLRWFPRHGFLFHLFEQLVIPLLGLRYDRVVYPYNSASIFSIFHRGSLLVVHDFIQNRKKLSGFNKYSSRLVRWTQWVYKYSSRDVAYITAEVSRQAKVIRAFPKSKYFIIPNCFYLFRRDALARVRAPDAERFILLCSGRVPTKDLAGALTLYTQSASARQYKLRILGLGGERRAVDTLAASLGLRASEYSVLPFVSDEELIDLYYAASLVWVHSQREGFGRNVAEAVICGRRVLASRILPFVRQARETPGIYLYSNRSPQEFDLALAACHRSDITCSALSLGEDHTRNTLRLLLERVEKPQLAGS